MSWLTTNLTVLTWLRFLAWIAVGAVVYLSYSRRQSLLAAPDASVDGVRDPGA